MTLKYMQGFETMRDDSDLRTQGWSPNPSKTSTRNTAFIPSVTGVAGTSLRPMGPFQSPLSNVAGWGGASTNDFGYLNTGITTNQAWLAGGVTFGFGAKFNSGVSASYGAGTATCMGACFDGTRYWAIRAVGSSYNVAYSTDLQNWTVTASQPAVTLDASATVSYMGGGMIALGRQATATTAYAVYYTTNLGASWGSQTLLTGTSTALLYGSGIATGNATYPHAWLSEGLTTGVYVGTIGGTMTQVASIATSSPNVSVTPRISGNILSFFVGQGNVGTIFSADVTNAALNTAAAWSTATLSGTQSFPLSMAYHPTANVWMYSSSLGIYTFPNTGAAGTPVAPTGSITLTQRYSTVGILNVFWNGSSAIGFGLQGHIVSSPDGVTWTESGGHVLPLGVSGTDWRSVVYDGSRYVIFSDATSGVIVTTPDGIGNFSCQYALEFAEVTQAIGGTTATQGTGLICGSAPSSTTGQWTGSGTGSAYATYLVVGPASAGARPIAVNTGKDGSNIFTSSVSITPLYHFYEMKLTAVAGTTNMFTNSLYVDGTLVGSATNQQYVATSDTTSLLIAVFQRNGVFTAIDDIYITLDDGTGLVGPLGAVNMVARRPTTDVQAQWVKNGSAASNSLTVNNPALSSQTANYLSSNNAGDKDIYTSGDVIPVGYSPKAVQLEATFTRGSTTVPSVNIGLISGGTESDSSTVQVGTSATYVTKIYQTDPNGNKAWTGANVTAAQMTASHIV